MSKDVVLTIDREEDIVTMDEVAKYSALISIGLMKNGQFYLKIEFEDSNVKKDEIILNYWRENRAIKITSKIIQRESYKISHVVITNMKTESQYGRFSTIYECISDEPGRSLIIS